MRSNLLRVFRLTTPFWVLIFASAALVAGAQMLLLCFSPAVSHVP